MSTSSAKVMLITGGSRGIGAATARLAAQRGWDVAVNYAGNKAAAEAVVADIRKAGRKAHRHPGRCRQARGHRAPVQDRRCRARPARRLLQQRRHRREGLPSSSTSRPSACSASSPSTRSAPSSPRRRRCGACRRGSAARAACIVNMSSMAAKLGGSNESTDYATSKGAIDTSPSAWPRSWRPRASASTPCARA